MEEQNNETVIENNTNVENTQTSQMKSTNVNQDNQINNKNNKKKGKKNKLLLVILLIVLIILAVEFIYFKDIFNSGDSTDNNSGNVVEETDNEENDNELTEKEEENKIGVEELDVNDILVQKVYDKTKWQQGVYNTTFEYLFKSENITLDEIPENIVISAAFTAYGWSSGVNYGSTITFTKEQFARTIKNYFGDYTYTDQDGNSGCMEGYRYDSTNERYIQVSGGCGGAGGAGYVENIIKAVKNNDQIELTTKAIFFVSDPNATGRCETYYSSPKHNEQSIIKEDCHESDNYSLDITSDNLSDYYDKLNSYKYTFKLGSDGNYYFYKFETLK